MVQWLWGSHVLVAKENPCEVSRRLAVATALGETGPFLRGDEATPAPAQAGVLSPGAGGGCSPLALPPGLSQPWAGSRASLRRCGGQVGDQGQQTHTDAHSHLQTSLFTRKSNWV